MQATGKRAILASSRAGRAGRFIGKSDAQASQAARARKEVERGGIDADTASPNAPSRPVLTQ